MKYEIGQRIKLVNDDKSSNRYIILATKTQNLDSEFLNSKTRKFSIHNFEKIAENGIEVNGGFAYVICREKEELRNGLCELTGDFISVMGGDIEI
jgi:hypothetical protein